MTGFPSISDEHRLTYDDVIAHLKDKRIRITETRRAIIAYLIQSKEHPSAEMMYKDLRHYFSSMSLATVYNNLKVLVDEGFVTEIKRTNDTTTYYDFMGHNHLNIICERCGAIQDVELEYELPHLESDVQAQTGYQITKEIMTLYGICPNCI